MSSLHQLIAIVSDIYEQIQFLLELAIKKKEVLVKGNVQELAKITNKEMFHIQKVGILEDKRLGIGRSITKEYNVLEKDITLNWVHEQLNSSDQIYLQELMNHYQHALIEMSVCNSANRKLLEQSIYYADQMLGLIAETVQGVTENYKSTTDKQVNQNRMPSYFDHRI